MDFFDHQMFAADNFDQLRASVRYFFDLLEICGSGRRRHARFGSGKPLPFPPNLALSVDGAAASDGNILDVLGIDQGRDGFSGATPGVIAQSVIRRVLTADDNRSRTDLENNVTAQLNGAGEILAGRKIDGPTSCLCTRVDCGLNGRRVLGLPVASGAKVANAVLLRVCGRGDRETCC